MSVDFSRIPADVVQLCRVLQRAGHEAYLVGGGVRDLLMGRPVSDWDVATSARPEQVRALFPRTVPIGIKHGTVAVLLPGRQVEVTTYRGEGAYSDGRHPDSVTFVRTLEEDLQRRDLTVNAMAVDPLQQELVDPMGGASDLKRGVIRGVGDPMARFGEDGLRPLRAVRFAATLGFTVEDDTREAIARSIDSFRKVSWERIRDELLKMLGAPRPSVGVELMRQTGLLAEVLPELLAAEGVSQNRYHAEDVYAHALAACDATQGDAILRLAALLHDVGKPQVAQPHAKREGEQTFYQHARASVALCEEICRRLKLSGEQTARVCHLVANHDFPLEGWSAAGLRRLLRRVGVEHLDDLFALRTGDLLGREGPDQLPLLEALRARIDEVVRAAPPLATSDLAVDGRGLMQHLGIQPGPAVGRILRALLERVLEDPSLNTEEQLLALARELGEEQGR